MISDEEKVSRLQRFFCDNGEALYGAHSPSLEGVLTTGGGVVAQKTITLESSSFTIPLSYPTSLPDLTIVPMWAGREIGWTLRDK
jgi:dihydroorotase